MLIDQAKIHVKAGDGGNGCTSFYRDKFVRKGKPNGGDGGAGGNLIFKVDKNIRTLLDFQYNRHFKAARGRHGGSNNKTGRSGEDRYVKVPPGTILKDVATDLLLRDLTHDGEEVIVAVGGSGGKGNTKKRDATSGEKGEAKELALELKLIADIGIIGYPNVGKSTLISRVSSAKSKIACYPFTTKAPILGIVKMYDGDLAFADMPGLIEGAHKGRGLGDEFLRHIERTRILVHMVDIAQVETRNAYDDYVSINNELSLYGRHLSAKLQVIACNKMDLQDAKKNLDAFRKKIDKKVFPISAVTGVGVKELLDEIWNLAKNG
ncbi:MAG: GTPase ObgE [Candidatus Omnitrophica bacterium]|nr:GTPase ObgE [Candidatus Omnitrophota bacterium]